MRLCILCVAFTSILAAQPRPQFRAPAAGAHGRVGPGHGPRVGGPRWAAPWWGSPGWWSSAFDYTPLRPPVDPPKEQPLLIRNPDYTQERMNPTVRDYPDGTLPITPKERVEQVQQTCRLKEGSGAEFTGRECQSVDDVVRWRSADGKWHRASLDLVSLVEPSTR